MAIKEELKSALETAYDIPFDVNSGIQDKEPWFEISPSRSRESLFKLLLTYKNAIRLNMSMQPQRYSANMVRAMGEADEEKRKAFAAFSKLMIHDGAKISLSINENAADSSNPDAWPRNWHSVNLRATVMPVKTLNDDTPDYKNVSLQWGINFTGMILSLLDIVPIDDLGIEEHSKETRAGFAEGEKRTYLANKYERNPINRLICLQSKGYKCTVCGFDFEEQYGDLGRGYIHVHHIIPVSRMGSGYIVDPLHDLVPVCPNCHAMLHRTEPPLSVEELKSLISSK